MKITIIIPDGAIAGVLNYVNIGEKDGAYLGSVILNDLEDGNLYDAVHEPPEE